jgi:hypothetical protein
MTRGRASETGGNLPGTAPPGVRFPLSCRGASDYSPSMSHNNHRPDALAGPRALGRRRAPRCARRLGTRGPITGWLAASFVAALCVSSSAATLNLKSGVVRYEVNLKTLGIGGDVVSAVNERVIGQWVVTGDGRIEGGLVVPVVGFDSNNTKRDKDVANILKYKEHPAITFEVLGVSAGDAARVLSADSGQVNIKARLSAAGGSEVYDVVLGFHAAGPNAIRFTTHIDAKFTDFGISPPRLGLILKRAPDDIDLSGDLTFTIEKE